MAGGEDPASPREDGDEIEIAQMDEEDVAEAERQPSQQRGRPAAAERAHEDVNAESGPPEMADAEQLHPAIVEGGIEKEQQKIGWIEKSGLNVADEGRAAIEMRIPERQSALAQGAGSEAVYGEEETDQIAAIGRLVDNAADGAPEESGNHAGQEGCGQQVPASLVTPAYEPCNCACRQQKDENANGDGKEFCSSGHEATQEKSGMCLSKGMACFAAFAGGRASLGNSSSKAAGTVAVRRLYGITEEERLKGTGGSIEGGGGPFSVCLHLE